MRLNLLAMTLFASIVVANAASAQTACVTDNGKPEFDITNANIASHLHWTNDTVWVLNKISFVPVGQTLVIDPGTVIKGRPKAVPADPAASLVVQRGSKIIADGTEACPIVWTFLGDDVDDAFDVLPFALRGQWGSLLLLGSAPICFAGGIQNKIEGIDTLLFPTQSLYGGINPDDSTGVVRYNSLRHGGSIIGAANEINGLTLGGVGRKTVVENVEVFANLDDGFEFFGGTVNCRNLVSAFNDDDNIDWDEGYSGAIQGFFAINDSTNGDSGGELNGTVNGSGGWAGSELCFSKPRVANATLIGRGPGTASQGPALNFRVMSGGKVFNSIVTQYRRTGLQVEYRTAHLDRSSYENVCLGNLDLGNNLFWELGTGAGDSSLFAIKAGDAFLVSDSCGTMASIFFDNLTKNNQHQNPSLVGISRLDNSSALDPRPDVDFGAIWKDVPAWNATDLTTIDPFFVKTKYAGAFDPCAPLWTDNWSYIWFRNITKPYAPLAVNQGTCSCCDLAGDADNDASVSIGDAVYLIGYIFLGGGAPPCLTEGDADGDASITIGDAVYLIGYIFQGGPGPVCGP